MLGQHDSDGEVEEEVVGDAPHGAVRQDDPQDHRVPHDCNHNDHSEEESPDDLLIPPGILLKTPSNVLSTVLTKTHFGSHRYKVKDIIPKGTCSGFGMIYEKYHGIEHSERLVTLETCNQSNEETIFFLEIPSLNTENGQASFTAYKFD